MPGQKPRPSQRPPDRIDRDVERLAGLRETDPDGASQLAVDLVARERVHRALEPALAILAEFPRDDARPALRQRFDDLTSRGLRYDQSCNLRTDIVRALRAIGSPDDRDLAEAALRTVQLHLGIDVAQALRAEGLLFLGEIDPDRAGWFAIDLLQDPHASTFSGEPAVTAIRVLAAAGHVLPIWAVARRPDVAADVLAAAFSALRRAPADLQLEALRAHLDRVADARDDGDAIALVAAEAIVLNGLRDGDDAVLNLVRHSPNLNLVRYLALTVARAGDAELRSRLGDLRRSERDPRRAAILDDVLG